MAQHDAIVVGARCAGSPLAMLLARQGYEVLVLDRSKFPSDMLSTHVVQPLGAAALARWGLLDRVIATGCPPVRTFSFDFGPLQLSGSPGTEQSPNAYCIRRTLLDEILVDAAVEAGAEVREELSVDELLFEDGRVVGIRGHSKSGASVTERARVVIGSDGRNSLVAKAVDAAKYNEKPPQQGSYYTYFADLPVGSAFEIHIRDGYGFGAAPTNDGLTMVVGGWAIDSYEEKKKDYERNFLAMLQSVPSFQERLRGARRVERFSGAVTPNYFRQPWGAGWALVGDAGYLKDPITAYGIMDAFLDAERCAAALDQALSGARPYDEAMAEYQRARDEFAMPRYEFTCQLASMQPPPEFMQQLFGAMTGNQEAMDGFVRVNAGTLSPAEFFSPANVSAILAAAGRSDVKSARTEAPDGRQPPSARPSA